NPGDRPPFILQRCGKRVDRSSDDTRGGRSGHADEILRASRRHALDVETREPPGAANDKSKAKPPSKMSNLLDQCGRSKTRQVPDAPGVGKQRRCNAKAHHVCE